MTNREPGSTNEEWDSTNEETSFIHMNDSEAELPDWIASRIDTPDNDRSLTQYQVSKEFVKNKRPYYNVSRMHAALGGGVSTDTVQSRLDELVQRDVLRSENVNNRYFPTDLRAGAKT